MPNPNPWGAFAEGLASGIQRGIPLYIERQMREIERKQQQDVARAEQNYKVFTDKNLPVSVRKQAYQSWRSINKDWNTGIQAPDIPDEQWESNELGQYFKRGQAILKNKEYGLQDKLSLLKELEVEAIDKVGMKSGEASRIFGGLTQQAERQQLTGLLQPTPEGKPSELMGGLVSAYGEEQARGISGLMESGIPFEEAVKAFPKQVQPTPKTVTLGGNLYQIKDSEAKLLKAGSIDEKATYNAMRDPAWRWADEQEQADIIEKHKRFLQGKKKPVEKLSYEDEAKQIWEESGHNVKKAEEIARQRNFKF